MGLEETLSLWKNVDESDRTATWKLDPVLKFFSPSMLDEFVAGKPTAFSMEQIFEVQDLVEKKQKEGFSSEESSCCSGLVSIFGPGGVRSKVARSHKLNKVIEQRLIELSQDGKVKICRGLNENENENRKEEIENSRINENLKMNESSRINENVEEYVKFAPGMPEEAKINIRNIPSKDGEIIGVIDSKSLLKSSGQNVGPYYCLELTDGRKGYALSETQDRKLLVSSKSPLKSSGFETQIKNSTQSAPNEFVPKQEFMTLKARVESLEADLKALKTLLRSA
mmetsp:Transcript_9257/g.11097  ORF Transcript_9257/g.11097 Transcript_9257/m.11097 type:complete len:282 (+) Transcript_9257:90-935(+)